MSREVYLVDRLGDGVYNCKNPSVPSICDGEFQPQLQNNSGKVCLLIAQKATDAVFYYYQRVLVKWVDSSLKHPFERSAAPTKIE